jgi:hypothetical protein
MIIIPISANWLHRNIIYKIKSPFFFWTQAWWILLFQITSHIVQHGCGYNSLYFFSF